jgi:3-hydroxybutyryl-CoA dehydrogenase
MTPQTTQSVLPSGALSPALNTIAVIGSGAMGRGIGQIFAQINRQVLMVDSNPLALEAAKVYFASTFAKLLEKGKLKQNEHDAALAKISFSSDLNDTKSCDLVVEAIIENLDVKRELFKKLEAIVANTALLVSNTSSLSITSIAAACKHPERVAGLHFFNPVPVMKVVEIVKAPCSSDGTMNALGALITATGHLAVICKDTPGFVVNHAGRGYGTEALRALGEGVAQFSEIDEIMREQVAFDGAGFKLGPFELLDLTGLDVSHPVMESIYHQYFEEPRFRPSVITKQRLDAQLLGRKTKRGFYDYSTGTQTLLAQDIPAPKRYSLTAEPCKVWIEAGPQRPALVSLVESLGASIDEATAPEQDSLVLIAPWGQDASQIASDLQLPFERVVAIDTLFAFGHQACKRRTIMFTPATSLLARTQAHHLFSKDGARLSEIRDSAGFIAQRVCAMIVNIACDIAQQQVATPDNIDKAVRMGLGYPQGPLSMGDSIGPAAMLTMLQNLQKITGDDRFRPSPWLRRRALLGMSLLAQE